MCLCCGWYHSVCVCTSCEWINRLIPPLSYHWQIAHGPHTQYKWRIGKSITLEFPCKTFPSSFCWTSLNLCYFRFREKIHYTQQTCAMPHILLKVLSYSELPTLLLQIPRSHPCQKCNENLMIRMMPQRKNRTISWTGVMHRSIVLQVYTHLHNTHIQTLIIDYSCTLILMIKHKYWLEILLFFSKHFIIYIRSKLHSIRHWYLYSPGFLHSAAHVWPSLVCKMAHDWPHFLGWSCESLLILDILPIVICSLHHTPVSNNNFVSNCVNSYWHL